MTENIKTLMDGALGKKVPANFALEDYDYNAALLDEMKKLAGDNKAWRRNKEDVFDLLAEELDEEFPQYVNDRLGNFVETRQFANGDRMEFRVRLGVRRGRQFVTRATESGVYETFRLDHDHFDVYPVAIGGGAYIDFERYLEGLEDLAVLYQIILDGMLDEVWKMIQDCLLKSWNKAGRPAANKVSVTAFDAAEMVKLCNVVRAYGDPVIYCTPEFAAEMVNAIVYDVAPAGTPGTWSHVSEQDLTEIRDRGYIGRFRGTPIVVIPQSYLDDQNTKLAMNPSFAYVIPAGKEKLVKLGYEGESYFYETTGHENTKKINGYKKVGVGMIGTPNFWGIYYNAGIDAGGWEEYNEALGL